MSKKAKKLGFGNVYKTIIMDEIPIYIKEYKCDKGKFIAIYNPNTAECTICAGEESEEEQIQKLKRPSLA